MKSTRCSTWLLTLPAIWLTAFTGLATEPPTVSDLTGQWQGQSRFAGISYAEYKQKTVTVQDVEIGLHISAEGTVTGRVGGAGLSGRVIAAHRGWFWRMLRIKPNFIIEGRMVGAVVPGSESGIHPITAPFTLDGARINGSLFAIYSFTYPYPFIRLQLLH